MSVRTEIQIRNEISAITNLAEKFRENDDTGWQDIAESARLLLEKHGGSDTGTLEGLLDHSGGTSNAERVALEWLLGKSEVRSAEYLSSRLKTQPRGTPRTGQ